MKKLCLSVFVGILLLGVFWGNSRVLAADKYYGNGVYCNKHTCHVNWGEARQSIGSIIYHGWMNGIGDVLGGVSRLGR